MNETKLANAQQTTTHPADLELDRPGDIRVLDDYELVLAGGGEGELTWP